MIRRTLLGAALSAAVVCAAPALSAQSSVTTAGAAERAAPLGFSFGWSGGISVGADGAVQVRDYPAVTRVQENSPAARAGVRPGDRIVSANGRDGRRPPLFEDVAPGSRVVLRIRRGDEEREISFMVPDPRTR